MGSLRCWNIVRVERRGNVVAVNSFSAEAQEWLDCIIKCDGAEVPEEDWSVVKELVDAGLVHLGSARGSGKMWKRATLVNR